MEEQEAVVLSGGVRQNSHGELSVSDEGLTAIGRQHHRTEAVWDFRVACKT